MADKRSGSGKGAEITREELIDLLNEDLAREYQAIIAYVVYSQVLKGAQYMNIADELKVHAGEELEHALILANQIDYLGGMPVVVPKPVKTSEKAEEMLRFDLDNENETIRNYRGSSARRMSAPNSKLGPEGFEVPWLGMDCAISLVCKLN
ncbi:MAG: ferritin-like domain-containing protein [Planctomycetia bacterium]|nr:ferritin-like domain-containing protein [Planctomycetia bacterium]